MRSSLLAWRRGALSVAFVAACTTSIQFSGCVRSSARDVGVNLPKQAADSALRAERAIASKNSSIHGENTGQSAARKTLLNGPSKTAATDNPLAKLLAEKPAKYPSRDPFIESEQSGDALARLLEYQPNSKAPQVEELSEVQLTQHSREQSPGPKEQAVDKGQASTSRMFPSERSRNNQHSQPAVAANISSESSPGIVHLENRRTEFTETSKDTKQENPQFAANELGHWKTLEDERPVAEVQRKLDAGDRENVSTSVSALEQKMQKRRVEALISQAKTQESRGELHAAYRSALLAKNQVEQSQLHLKEKDVQPEKVVTELAAKIWGARDVVVANQSEPQLPLIQPRRSRSPQHDRVFQTSQNYLDWQSPEHLHHQSPKKVQTEHSLVNRESSTKEETIVHAEGNVETVLDEWTPFSNSTGSTIAQVSGEISSASSTSSLRSLKNSKPTLSKSLPAATESNLVQARPMPAPTSFVGVDTTLQFEPTTEPARPPLIAPSVVETNPFQQQLTGAPITEALQLNRSLDPPERAASLVTEKVPPRNSLKWGVIAFVLAIFSALMGLRLSQRKPTEQPDEAAKPEESSRNQIPLKISKAA